MTCDLVRGELGEGGRCDGVIVELEREKERASEVAVVPPT